MIKKLQESIQIITTLIKNCPLQPTIILDSTIIQLNINQLKVHNIKALILDLDNTIMVPDTGFLLTEIVDWLNLMKENNIEIIILSNNLKKKYLQKVSVILDQYNLEIIGGAAKPYRENILISIAKLQNQNIDIAPENIAIVGDRILTDILGGVHMNIPSILVKPLIGNKEVWYKRWGRQFEYLFVNSKL